MRGTFRFSILTPSSVQCNGDVAPGVHEELGEVEVEGEALALAQLDVPGDAWVACKLGNGRFFSFC